MTRSRHEAPLEFAGTTVHGGRARRRADLEEQLHHALAAGDRQRISELHVLLAELEGEVAGRGRRTDW